jgi:hypothetical protein
MIEVFGYTDDDLRFVAETAGAGRCRPEEAPAVLRAQDGLLDVMLEDDRLVERVLGDDHALLHVSPRLVFSVLLRRVVRDLQGQRYTLERGGGETVAVFDAPRVRRFVAEPEIWTYLVSMLASFVRNESVTVLVRRREHYIRRRFNTSSLDDMMALAGLVDADEVPWIFRRIADIALFQSGIFPRSLRGVRPRAARASVPPTVATYEEHGRRFYRLAASRAAEQPRSAAAESRVLRALAEEFPAARKSLELLSDRYLRWTPCAVRWFPGYSDGM